MPDFSTPLDIQNRALQHIGANRIASTSEVSRNNSETTFAYDKLRKAELQSSYWKFAIKNAILRPINSTFMLLAPALWSASTVYFNGSVVSDANGIHWQSYIPSNVGNQPGINSGWRLYFGPMAIPPWDSTGGTSYLNGDVVYVPGSSGAYSVYLSLIAGNSDNPGTVTAYSATTTYAKDAIVTYNAVAYQSLIDLNLNNEPDLAPAPWSVTTTYATGAQVGGSDGVIYQSVTSGNLGNNPIGDNGTHWTSTGVLNPWTTVITRGAGSTNWLLLGCALSELIFTYPIGAGPNTQTFTRNVYHLPANYLRKANQHPKVPVASLGGPSGISEDDWTFEDDYLVTSFSSPIVFRFVADFTDVRKMETMFCEGIAFRIALEVCDTLTQSGTKYQTVASGYKKFMTEAKMVDAIENEYSDPPDDEFISVRY